jgi:hypothetical protein
MRIPRHPNIVSFDALVIDKIGGVDRAVGFTTAHIPGDPLYLNMHRTFKLKYVEQLIDVSVPLHAPSQCLTLTPSRLLTT